jgi:hypothetical protein
VTNDKPRPQNTNRLNPRRQGSLPWSVILAVAPGKKKARTSCLFLSLRIYFFQFADVFIAITRGYSTSNTEKKTDFKLFKIRIFNENDDN